MNAEILCVGTELLIGDIVNTNSAFLSRALAEMGINVFYHSVVGDNDERLKKSLTLALERSDVVIMTGGLGPTYDDMTKETVASLFNLEMVMHEQSLSAICAYFSRTGRKMTENNKKQAIMPYGATVFQNDCGTAPGLAVEKNGKTVILLPGPPREMQPMFINHVGPYLMKFSQGCIVSKNINLFGVGESSVEALLYDMMKNAANPSLATYADDGELRIRVSALAKTSAEAQELINPYIEKISSLLKDNIYGIDMQSVEEALVKKLSEHNLTIATCESCTGGLISKKITDISGSSKVFGYGICTYANEAKTSLLGVKSETLNEYGAVSEQTAREMAQGLLKLSGADIAISTTGIAGPGGGTDQKPVGLVYVGCASKRGVKVKKLLLCRGNTAERSYIRTLAAKNALKIALDEATLLINGEINK